MSYITSEHKLCWDIGWQFCFLSYFLMGYKLRQWGKKAKSNKKAVLLIVSGIVINVALAYINYLGSLRGMPLDVEQFYKNPFSYTPLAPIEVIASCLIFAGFSVLDIKGDLSRQAKYTFLIYLIHAGVCDVILTAFGDRWIGDQTAETVAIVSITAVVCITSFVLSVLYERFAVYISDHMRRMRACGPAK